MLCMSITTAYSCTSVIVSGRLSPDGRPMIMKNRDSYTFSNAMAVIHGERHRFLAVVNAGKEDDHQAWSGHNDAGFAIANTAAYNLNGSGVNDGRVMYRALELCATLKDFENMLDTLRRPMKVDSNFAVLDAEGGCAYYEVGDSGYVKFDCNDPMLAPYGYMVRTNHAYTGERRRDKGVDRYYAIADFMLRAYRNDYMDAESLITMIPRYLTHGGTRVNLYDMMPDDASATLTCPFSDFIPRDVTTSVELIQGVRPGEDPLLTCAWCIVGNPLTTPVTPLYLLNDDALPAVVSKNADGVSVLCEQGLERKKIIFNDDDDIILGRLINKQGDGVLQQVRMDDKEILERHEDLLDALKGKYDAKAIKEYYRWLDEYLHIK